MCFKSDFKRACARSFREHCREKKKLYLGTFRGKDGTVPDQRFRDTDVFIIASFLSHFFNVYLIYRYLAGYLPFHKIIE